MNIINGWPPNISEIRQYLTPSDDALFCFGTKLYNPSGKEIPEDVLVHERIHAKQQDPENVFYHVEGDSASTPPMSPELWWTNYLLDRRFRLDQELEAYAAQYAYIKQHYPPKAHKEALFELAENLCSPMYDLRLEHEPLTLAKAESMIRLRAQR